MLDKTYIVLSETLKQPNLRTTSQTYYVNAINGIYDFRALTVYPLYYALEKLRQDKFKCEINAQYARRWIEKHGKLSGQEG